MKKVKWATSVVLSCVACAGHPEDSVDDDPRLTGDTEQVATSAQTLWAGLPALKAYSALAPGADYNRCVPDAAGVLNRMNARGELLGLHYSAAGYTPLDGEKWHSQGIVRLPFYEWDSLLRGQFFAASFSHPGGTGPHYDSHLGIAQLGYRGGNEGKAVGSNRMFNANYTGPRSDWDVTPNPGDTFIPVGGSPQFKIDEYENHPGGMSALGWHVIVALQKWTYAGQWFSATTPPDSNPLVKIYDLWDPSWPTLRSSFLTHIGPVTSDGRGTDAMAAGITKLADGRFLMAVTKASPTNQVEFYVSTGTSLDAPDLFGAPNRLPDAVWATGGWQNINFITDCDSGNIYMLGFKGADGGVDAVEMYRIDLFGSGTYPNATFTVNTTFMDTKHLYCSDNYGQDQCDLKAAAGSYVDPKGHVVLYGTGYSNDGGATSWVHGNGTPSYGSSPSQGGYIRGVEFRERHGNTGPAAVGCPTLADAWVEFYEHPDFNANGENAGLVYRIDYADRDKRNAKDLNANLFNDKASSVRWCLPAGHSFAIYRDRWAGASQYLKGSGDVRYISNLSNSVYGYGGGSVNDTITSYWFADNYVDPKGWAGGIDLRN
jgi:hypothetical protein